MNNKLMKGEEASQTQFWWAPDGMERRALAEQLWLGVKSASSLQPMAGCKPVLSFHSAQPAWNPTGCGLYFTLLACGSFSANQVEHLPAPRTKALKVSPRSLEDEHLEAQNTTGQWREAHQATSPKRSPYYRHNQKFCPGFVQNTVVLSKDNQKTDKLDFFIPATDKTFGKGSCSLIQMNIEEVNHRIQEQQLNVLLIKQTFLSNTAPLKIPATQVAINSTVFSPQHLPPVIFTPAQLCWTTSSVPSI